ncbi:hypothetical protein [Macrococcoides canis]|uniref:Cap15 family cyclic dinucleotide receptor domain-containing protein n=1 Tax=Macrococcoides canis TaxID=1855823 RepID=UPI00165DE249|nr:hypothetical protein [Macrococcus canis]QNR09097.1 hypothetical protein GL258_12490 [Macrococcus canis]
MKDKIKFLITWASGIAIILFLIIYFWLTRIFSFIGFLDALSYSISVTSLIFILFESCLWKFCYRIHKEPLIFGKYTGVIKYSHQYGENKTKDIEVSIEQSYLFSRVYLKTNEISSSSLTSSIVNENGESVLYYTYITNPKDKYSESNPINRGTARLVINNKGLEGGYWTNRKTTGDIILNKIS